MNSQESFIQFVLFSLEDYDSRNRCINIATDISYDSNHWANATPIQSDRLKELALKRDLLATAKAILDKHGSEALSLMLEQSNMNATHPDSKIVFGRSGGRASLFKAADEAKERLIIVCPWLSRKSIDNDMLLKFIALLAQGIRLDIGWGYQYDIGKIIRISGNGKYFIDAKGDEWQNYSALPRLHELQQSYPGQLTLKLLGTHAKYLVCDSQFAYVGSHNLLSSNLSSQNTCYPDLVGDEVGTLHRSPDNIQKLINRFDNQPDLSTDYHR